MGDPGLLTIGPMAIPPLHGVPEIQPTPPVPKWTFHLFVVVFSPKQEVGR